MVLLLAYPNLLGKKGYVVVVVVLVVLLLYITIMKYSDVEITYVTFLSLEHNFSVKP